MSTKISALPASAGLVSTDIFPVVDDPSGTPTNQKATIGQISVALSGNFVLKAGDTMTGELVINPLVNTEGLTVSGFSLTGTNVSSLLDLSGTWNTSGSPSGIKINIINTASSNGRLLDLRESGTTFFSVNAIGRATASGGYASTAGSAFVTTDVTGLSIFTSSSSLAASALTISGIWSNGHTPTAVRVNMTNISSGAASLLLDLSLSSINKWKCDKNGAVTQASTLTISAGGLAVSGNIGFFGTAAVAQQVSAANLTNNVTAGGTNDTIANFTDLVVYATDAAAIRNDIYQLSRKLKQVNDALRAYGILT